MQIPNRLKVIGDLIPDGAYIADVGADHGLLEQYIALSKENYHILAIENKEGPLTALRNSVDCLKNVEVSHSDGLNQVSKDYDTIVLAGMGGDNIVEILSKNKSKLNYIQRIIVDAHSFIPKVREAIIGYGFDIECEKIVHEAGIYYIIISFIRNSESIKYSEDEIEFGYKLYEDPLFKKYKNKVLKELQTIKKQIKNIPSQNEKYKQISSLMRRLKSYGQN